MHKVFVCASDGSKRANEASDGLSSACRRLEMCLLRQKLCCSRKLLFLEPTNALPLRADCCRVAMKLSTGKQANRQTNKVIVVRSNCIDEIRLPHHIRSQARTHPFWLSSVFVTRIYYQYTYLSISQTCALWSSDFRSSAHINVHLFSSTSRLIIGPHIDYNEPAVSFVGYLRQGFAVAWMSYVRIDLVAVTTMLVHFGAYQPTESLATMLMMEAVRLRAAAAAGHLLNQSAAVAAR